MKKVQGVWVAACLTLAGCSNDVRKEVQKSQENKALYTLGQVYARRVETLNLTEKEAELVILGFKDWTVKKIAEVDYDSNRAGVQKLLDDRMIGQAKEEKEKGRAYLEKFVKEGGTKTPSGLAYKIIKAGSNKRPKLSDTVEVHYHGTFINGQVFDSSIVLKEKANFPLNRIIPGWAEGLQLIGEGGEIELVVPSDLAYGDRGSVPQIPGGATLVFKIELFKVMSQSK